MKNVITLTNSYTTIATLPEGFRPAIDIPFTYNKLGANDYGQGAYVEPNGAIALYSTTESNYYSFSVSFPV